MHSILVFSWLLLTAPAAPVAPAADVSGMWELQAIGQDGTSIQVENTADVIVLYRVMHPEFEGETYTLEHFYKGRIVNGKITGNLLVRDDPKLQFENLRPFDGQIKNATYMIVDDLPLKLIKAGKVTIPVTLPVKKKGKRADNEAAPANEAVATAEDVPEDQRLLENILGGAHGDSMINISARIRLPSPADDYTKAAEQAEKSGRHAEAYDYYSKALEIDPKRLELYSRAGDVLFKLKRYDEAKKLYQQALRFDPNNKTLRAQLKKTQKTSKG